MAKTIDRRETTSAERMLNELDPATDAMKDGRHLRAIGAALEQLDKDNENLRAAVLAAHDAGDSWTMIGLVLGTSRQAAHRKYARPVAD